MRPTPLAAALALVAALAVPALAGVGAQAPGLNLGDRIVPEAWETDRHIHLFEARAMLDAIQAAAPQYVEVLEVGESFGWPNAVTGAHDTWPVFAVEVTDRDSPVPREEKRVVVFQLSIHGNEKGGREGGLRVIEDLAVPRLYGAEYRDLLDELIVVFTFPNVDGWMKADAPYRTACARYWHHVELPTGQCAETQGYVRFNGNGQDMNRDWPTQGWYDTRFGREHALSEPEMAGMEAYLRQFAGRTVAAWDMHGMSTPADGGFHTPVDVPFLTVRDTAGEGTFCLPAATPVTPECLAQAGHFVLGLVSTAQADPATARSTTRQADAVTDAVNEVARDRYGYWAGLPSVGVVGGDFMSWGTDWDTLGYTDSGFTGTWFLEALGAPGGTLEYSYNNILFDTHYIPELNDIFVQTTRAVVRAVLDDARVAHSVLLHPAAPIDVLAPDAVLRGDTRDQDGPHLHTDEDDAYVGPYEARPAAFFDDLASRMPRGVLAATTVERIAAGDMRDVVVVAGDAWDRLADHPGAVAALRAHVEGGGRLVITDAALAALEALGLAAPGSVQVGEAYLGHIDLDADHPLAAGVRGLARQTYNGLPLGYARGEAPVWTVRADALAGADVAGTTLGPDRASLGRVALGAGEVVFLGALLPTPTVQHYHPYGLADHAVTYTGYQILYNALAITEEAVEGDGGPEEPATQRTRWLPAPPVASALALLLLAALAGTVGRRR